MDPFYPPQVLDRYDYVRCMPWSLSFLFDKSRARSFAGALADRFWAHQGVPATDDLAVKVDVLGLLKRPDLRCAVDAMARGEPMPYVLARALGERCGTYLVAQGMSEFDVKIVKNIAGDDYRRQENVLRRFSTLGCENDLSPLIMDSFPDDGKVVHEIREEMRALKKEEREARALNASAPSFERPDIDFASLSEAAISGYEAAKVTKAICAKDHKKGSLTQAQTSLVHRLQALDTVHVEDGRPCPGCGGVDVVVCDVVHAEACPDCVGICYSCLRTVAMDDGFAARPLSCPSCKKPFDKVRIGSVTEEWRVPVEAPPVADGKRKRSGTCTCCRERGLFTPDTIHNKSKCPLNAEGRRERAPRAAAAPPPPHANLGAAVRASNAPSFTGMRIRLDTGWYDGHDARAPRAPT